MNSDSLPENTSLYRLHTPSGHTLQELIANHIRPDGTKGLRVRELIAALHIGSETLQVARVQPECLSLANLFGLAEFMGITPGKLVADVFHQVGQQRQSTHPPTNSKSCKRYPRPATPKPSVGGELIQQIDPTPTSEPHQALLATDFPSHSARKVAYADATFPQRSLALASVQQELSAYFPTLPWLRWAEVLNTLQPNLWVEMEGEPQVTLDQPALQRLLEHLDCTKESPLLKMTVHTIEALLMARRLAQYGCYAVLILVELEQNPSAYGDGIRALLFRLASGHPDEEKVLRAHGESIASVNSPGEPRPDDLLPGSPAVMDRIFKLSWPHGGPDGFTLPPRIDQ